MRKIISWFSWQRVILFFILGVVVYLSRLSGSQWLIGWDSVMPDLNWKLNLSRALFGMWQEYQGLGLTGGMAHLADLTRILLLWVMDIFLPTSYVRWIWHVGMLALGPIGVWYLGKRLWRWSENASLAASVFYLLNLATVQYFFVPYESFSSFYGFLPWLIGVFLAYLESGTKKDLGRVVLLGVVATSAFYVQTLFVVYLMVLGTLSLSYLRQWRRIFAGFLTIFALNSFWLLPIIYGVMNGGGLVGLAKINSIGSPETALMNSAFGDWQNVSLLKGFWLEYIEWVGGTEWGRLMQAWHDWSDQGWVMWGGRGMLGLSLVGLVWGVAKRKVKWAWTGGLLLAYMIVASFSDPFGGIYQWLVDNIPLFGEMFRSVFTKWSVVLALFVSVGIGAMVTSAMNRWVAGLMATLILIGCTAIAWPVFRTGIIFDKMKVELPSEYLSMFEFMKSQPMGSRLAYLPTESMWSWKYTDWGYRGSGFLWYGIEQPILDRAFDVWSPYNESFYNEFSNAIYFCNPVRSDLVGFENGLQPTRSDLVEQGTGCGERVARVLDKYDVRYVLLDESVIAPGQSKVILRIEETKMLASELGWEEKFQEGFLTVWEVNNLKSQILKFSNGEPLISAPGSYTWVEADPPSPTATDGQGTSKVREDVVWEEVGTYISANRRILRQSSGQVGGSAITYPFAGMMREEIKGVEYGEGKITLSSDHSLTQGSELRVPGWEVGDIVRIDYLDNEPVPAYYVNPPLSKTSDGQAGQPGPRFLGEEKPDEGESYILARVSEGEEWSEYLVERKYEITNSKIEIEVRGEPHVYDFGIQGQGTIGNCDVLKRGSATKSQIPNSQILKSEPQSSDHSLTQGSELGQQATVYIADGRGAVCDYVVMGDPYTRLSYLMRVQGENVEGRSLKFFLWNTGSERNDIEWLMDGGRFDQTFGLLPWDFDGYYTLNIETRSFGQRAENRIEPVEVRHFPLAQIARAKVIINPKFSNSQNGNWLQVTEVKKNGTWLYRVKVEGSGLLKLSQGYDEGWIGITKVPNLAYNFAKFGTLEHVKVDGWANGWIIDNHKSQILKSSQIEDGEQVAQIVIIFYWPQLLQYLGFAILGGTIIWIIRAKKIE